MSTDHSSILAAVCELLSSSNTAAAAEMIRRDYPFEPVCVRSVA